MVRVATVLPAARAAAGPGAGSEQWRAVRTLLFRVADGSWEGRVAGVDGFSQEVMMWQLVGGFLVKLLKVTEEFFSLWEVFLKQAMESKDFWVFQYLVCSLSDFMEITCGGLFKGLKCIVLCNYCSLIDFVAVLKGLDELYMSFRTAMETEKESHTIT